MEDSLVTLIKESSTLPQDTEYVVNETDSTTDAAATTESSTLSQPTSSFVSLTDSTTAGASTTESFTLTQNTQGVVTETGSTTAAASSSESSTLAQTTENGVSITDSTSTLPQTSESIVTETDSYHSNSVIKKTLHGTIYQLRLLMWIAFKANAQPEPFKLSTENGEFGLFDDIGIHILNENSTILYQAKHFQDTNRKITFQDLVSTTKTDPFGIPKYLQSIFNTINNNVTTSFQLNICTNIEFDFGYPSNIVYNVHDKNQKIEFEKIEKADRFLYGFDSGFEEERFSLFRIKNTTANINLFTDSQDFNDIVSKIFDGLVNDKPIRHNFKHKRAIMNYIIDPLSNGKLIEKLIEPSTKMLSSDKLFDFKIALDESINERLQSNRKDVRKLNCTLAEVLNREINVTGKEFTLQMVPELKDPQVIADLICEAISNKLNNNTINVNVTKLNDKDNDWTNVVKMLTGHIFVYRDDSDDIDDSDEEITVNNYRYINFSSNFLKTQDRKRLLGNLEQFRTAFFLNLKNDETLARLTIKNLQILIFRIGSKTCNEKEFNDLIENPIEFPQKKFKPIEVKNLMDNLVFIVNLPNEVDLGIKFNKKIGEKFNLSDASFISNCFLNNFLDWFKTPQGNCFYKTSDGIENIFIEQKDLLNTITLIGPTLVFVTKLRQMNSNDSKPINSSFDSSVVEKFLRESSKQKLNFVSNDGLGSRKIIKVLDNMDTYKNVDSYIFIPLDVLVTIEANVVSAFRKSKVLIVDCGSDKWESNTHSIFEKLLEIFESSENKKLIIISGLKCDRFKETEHYHDVDPPKTLVVND